MLNLAAMLLKALSQPNKLVSTARKGERTQGSRSVDGALGIWDAEVFRSENNSSREGT